MPYTSISIGHTLVSLIVQKNDMWHPHVPNLRKWPDVFLLLAVLSDAFTYIGAFKPIIFHLAWPPADAEAFAHMLYLW